MKDKYYITTPIYYPSGNWHLGTCYTTVICDALARFKRMQGKDVFYLTGTDEHGMKVEKKSAEVGLSPKEYVDKQVAGLKDIWARLGINYDKFIRTTDDYHEKAVQKIFKKLYDQGDIYKSEYEGWYCTPCESFWTQTQLVDGKCPDCGREVVKTKEESYFFRLSKYQDRLIKLIEENEEFLEPKSRRNEMLNNFLRPGLTDLAVSRTSFKWGVPVDFDPKHVVYVWVDALTNYITALGYGSDDTSLFEKFWPAEVHLMGKEIVRFHSIIWPAILMALDLPLPKKVYGHGWLLLGNDKMSKSKGNTLDPVTLCDKFGADAVRYFLLREVPFGQDGVYTNRSLLTRINADLANDLGNLVSRTSAMIAQYFGGELPAPGKPTDFDQALVDIVDGLYAEVDGAMDGLNAPDALIAIWKLIQRANKYIDETMPWALNKAGDKDTLATVMYNLAECIRIATVYLQAFFVETPDKIFASFGVTEDLRTLESARHFGESRPGARVVKGEALFPRIDIEKELKALEEVKEVKVEVKEEPKKAPVENVVDITEITIDEFAKVDLRVAKVLTAEKVEKADKLLKMTMDVGGKERTVVSGIAKYYTPDEMVGKSVILVANLKPAKLRGILSEGMILCASDDEGNLVLISPEKGIKSGSEVR